MCYLLVFTFFILNTFCVFTSWAHFRFNVELSLYPRQHWLLYPSVSLGNLTWPYNRLKLWLLGAQVYGDRALTGTADQGRIASWIIWDSEPSKSIHSGVQKKSRLNTYIAQICWKMTRSLLQLVCVCVKTAYTCSLQGVSSVEWLSECQHSSLSFLDDKS